MTTTLPAAVESPSRSHACNITRDIYRWDEEVMASRRPGRRAYGWTDDDTALVPNEALELRHIVADLDAGVSRKQVVRKLNDRRIPTASGNQWSVTALTRMLKNPRMIGRKADSMGRPIMQGPPAYPAVFTTDAEVAQWRRVRTKLLDPKWKQKRGENESVLGDRVRCGLCGAQMYLQQPTGRAPRYSCHADTGCGRMSIQAHLVDDFVARSVVEHAAQVITPAVPAVKVATWWTAADLEQRRELVAGMVESVTVEPAAAAGRGEDRLTIKWSDMPAWPAGITTS